MTNLTQQPVMVEQCDRDAAVEFLRICPSIGDRVVAGGQDDHCYVQAFARHRLAERERAARYLESKADEMRGSVNGNMMARIFEEQATAIRSGKEPA